ncbi:hypothetical protein BK708_13515 [Bacillus thuringiensis serovar yunnanensis]|nr:hypothetical protein BK708_13515 [Bacillus thuringiensis serovar yunnanensis]
MEGKEYVWLGKLVWIVILINYYRFWVLKKFSRKLGGSNWIYTNPWLLIGNIMKVKKFNGNLFIFSNHKMSNLCEENND